jgi:hypothetical protein
MKEISKSRKKKIILMNDISINKERKKASSINEGASAE